MPKTDESSLRLQPVKVHTCQFVLSSELFKGFPTLFDQFKESAPDFTWGSNNRSLVTVEAILNHMDGCASIDDYPLSFRQRCDTLGLQMYVDLEN